MTFFHFLLCLGSFRNSIYQNCLLRQTAWRFLGKLSFTYFLFQWRVSLKLQWHTFKKFHNVSQSFKGLCHKKKLFQKPLSFFEKTQFQRFVNEILSRYYESKTSLLAKVLWRFLRKFMVLLAKFHKVSMKFHLGGPSRARSMKNPIWPGVPLLRHPNQLLLKFIFFQWTLVNPIIPRWLTSS